MVRAHIRFFGTVQGVGFRYTCVSFAKPLELTGWVKNLSDGSVQALAEGPRETIEELISQLKNEFGSFVRETQVEWAEGSREFDKFSIT